MRSAGPALRRLDISNNSIGATGGKILYDALRENTGSSLTFLDMRYSRLDAAAEKHLNELAARRVTLELVLHPNGKLLKPEYGFGGAGRE